MSTPLHASEIARKVGTGTTTARAVITETLERIARLDPKLGAFTDTVGARALARADAIDADSNKGPLAGVPFAVKNLFDVEGLPTRAGSLINRDNAPATADAMLITRLEAAGAILVGALNMGEYAYDFTGQNVHDGPSRNPHDLEHMSGGSSGGSGTAAAAGLVPIALGSDTNGSIRVPASLCGLYGLKPTYGRLSRHGSFPFVTSLDHLGPLARSVTDLALSYDAMQGHDPNDPAQTERSFAPTMPTLETGISGLRIATAGGYFTGEGPARAAVEYVAKALGVARMVTVPEAERARAAAYLITMAEGAEMHVKRLRARTADFDPDVRDRLIAGAMLPATWPITAQKFRRHFRKRVLDLFGTIDVLLAPATPMTAPRLGQQTALFDGVELPVRPNLGMFTQPISFIGLPVVAVPVWLPGQTMPIGVQVIAPPWREDICLRVARLLEAIGVTSAPVAKDFANG